MQVQCVMESEAEEEEDDVQELGEEAEEEAKEGKDEAQEGEGTKQGEGRTVSKPTVSRPVFDGVYYDPPLKGHFGILDAKNTLGAQ